MDIGVSYTSTALEYSGFIRGAAVGSDILVSRDKIYCLMYSWGKYTFYTNDAEYKNKLPDYFEPRNYVDISYVYKETSVNEDDQFVNRYDAVEIVKRRVVKIGIDPDSIFESQILEDGQPACYSWDLRYRIRYSGYYDNGSDRRVHDVFFQIRIIDAETGKASVFSYNPYYVHLDGSIELAYKNGEMRIG